jgi:V/A-type H+-transporting ATPase subunit I
MLQDSGAEPLEIPPEMRRGRLPREEAERINVRLAAIAGERAAQNLRLAAIAEDNRAFLCAAEEALVALLEKNHGSTYCAESRYLLVSRFWVPSRDADAVMNRLRDAFKQDLTVLAEPAPDRHHAEAGVGEEPGHGTAPPTRLRNHRWLRPFESLIELYGLPDYCELDPTILLGLTFPLFFGFMIGDAGYGLAMILAGIVLRRRSSPAARGMSDLAWCLLLGGVSALGFGLFVFGDAFAIPFQAEHGAVFCWSRLLGGLPHPLIVKTESSAVATMLILAIAAGWVHMSIGCVMGFFNALGHSLRHAAARIGQLLVLTGMVLMILGQPAFRADALGGTLWGGMLSPVDAAGAAAVVCWLLAAGAALMAAGEGPAGLIEFFGLFSNVVSFSRLALVGVAKAAVAMAVNGAILPMMVDGGVGAWLLGLLLMVAAHAVLAGLGALTASIQSLRLNYFEAFSKFYKGGGRTFAPFGGLRIHTRA